MKLKTAAFIAGLICCCFLFARGAEAYDYGETPVSDLTLEEENNIEVFNKTGKSVVYVTNSQIQEDFFSLNIYEIPAGTGTGFVWDKNGLIVTNYHVIKFADKVMITLWDQSHWKAKLIGKAPNKDLAVLKIEAPTEKLFPLKLGDSKKLTVGRKVLAIGNPFGLDATLTVGVVSALNREIEIQGKKIKGLIQTDAAINPGNSGGPLLNSKGELVGVNTLIISPSMASAGVGFAIPVNAVKKIAPQLIKYGKVMRPKMGIYTLDDRTASRYGIEGVVILRVQSGFPAHKAGLKGISRDIRRNIILGDVIVKLNDQIIQSQDDLFDALELYKPGDEVLVETRLNGSAKNYRLRLAAPE